MIPTDNWKISLVGEKRILGQAVLWFNMKGEGLQKYYSQVLFSTLDSGEDVIEMAKKIGKTFSPGASPMAIARNLIGTGSGPISGGGWFDVECSSPFNLRDIDGKAGTVQGGSAGFAFGFLSYTVEVEGLFKAEISGITASMMFPTYSKSGEKGRWRLIGGVTEGKSYLGDANQEQILRGGTRA